MVTTMKRSSDHCAGPASTLDARRQLNGSVLEEASRLLERYNLDANTLDPTLCPPWEEFSELLTSELLNGPIQTNYQFLVRTLNRLVNHEVGLPNNESRTERNIHKSQMPTWTANELHTGISALPAVVVTLTQFMDLWKDAFADEEDAFTDEEDATPVSDLTPDIHEHLSAQRCVLRRMRTSFEELMYELEQTLV